MSDKLLPCPFCGNEKNIAMANEKHDHSGGYFIACPACDASTGLRYAMGDDPRPLLVEQWNRRAPDAEAAVKQARIDALEEAKQAVSAEKILEPEDNADDSYNCGVLDCVRAIESLKGKTP